MAKPVFTVNDPRTGIPLSAGCLAAIIAAARQIVMTKNPTPEAFQQDLQRINTTAFAAIDAYMAAHPQG